MWYGADIGKHMELEKEALVYYYRNPPKGSGAKQVSYSKIPALVKKELGGPLLKVSTCKMTMKNFKVVKKTRGRKTGWRKTTPEEDATILATFSAGERALFY